MFSPNCVVALLAPELAIKSTAVRVFMQTRLRKNIVLCMKNSNASFSKIVFLGGRFVISSDEPKKVLSSLRTCFGIHSLFLAEEKTFSSLEDLCASALLVAGEKIKEGTFAIRGKSYCPEFKSKTLEENLGGVFLDKYPKLKVNLSSPEHEFFCIADKNKAIFYFEEIVGARGMPVGSQGKAGLIVDNYSKEELFVLGKNLLKTGCSLILVGSKEIDLPKLAEWNSYEQVKFVNFVRAKEFYSHEGILAFFSCAKTISETERDSELVGIKVFTPLLFD